MFRELMKKIEMPNTEIVADGGKGKEKPTEKEPEKTKAPVVEPNEENNEDDKKKEQHSTKEKEEDNDDVKQKTDDDKNKQKAAGE